MFSWVENVGQQFAGWLGSGLGSFFQWIFNGVAEILTKLIDAADGIWGLFDAVWDLFVGFKDLILELLVLFFPFIPPEVMAVISWGMFAGAVFGVIKLIQKVRG